MTRHVYPLGDTYVHCTEGDGTDCWCGPTIDDDLVIHRSHDRREEYEDGRKLN